MSEFSRYAMVTIFIFLASCAAGVMVSSGDPGAGEQLLGLFREAIVGEILDSAPSVLALKLFVNNLQACTFMFLGGASLGLLTAFIILANGVVIGAVAELVRQQQGLLCIAAALVPHGVFEISAFVISGTLGFLLARDLWQEWRGVGDAAASSVAMGKTFLFVVVPLVAVAAFTEVFITPEILRLVA
ncbi:MAG TPA: stage II sporulation protein M [Methanoregulaceae archaeon]|nr:MAG: stage II sporulation protein M [Methanolinea sp.]HON80969.1 stage II sporulation protein M [Methanoregulaceae archaeon]HPD09724.1 stage II sporulation protein M [Methanoregulaceae archaeon]HRT14555.1 stage II sporulation protein M [Methanoregulaceae archaeon]HRU30126.1 stage II sporulation protein M [Methanoregulaceae archaeon]